MSPSNRGSQWSNAGIVVEIRPEDLPDFQQHRNLRVLKFQEYIEELTWQQGRMHTNCPGTAHGRLC